MVFRWYCKTPNSCLSQGIFFYMYAKVMIKKLFGKKPVQFDKYTCQASPHKFVGSSK